MGKVHFRTSALLKSIIGKDLITDDNIAVLELVKNSFDAGSNKVIVEFLHILNSDNSKIIISDTGIGMSDYDLENKWLNIAFSEKKEKKEEYGRILAGNKGVGRFSCDKLGKYLTIYTRKKNSNFIKLFIDWQWFEKEGDINLNIQDIEFDITELTENEFASQTNYSSFASGTILEIKDLRESWSYNKILFLKRQLERLINPNQSFKSTPFEVEIKALDFVEEEKGRVEFEKINGLVKNRIFDNLNFKTTSIEAEIDENGSTITTKLQDRGSEIFQLTEKNNFHLLKNIKIFIYYLNPYSKAYFTKQTGIRSVDFGSIFLFINGFRIPPYGDEGDDWLGMENRKGQGYNRYLGTREVVGRIEVQDENESFKIISSRAGIVNNDIFNQLVKNNSPFGFYYKIFRRLERFVVEGIKWDSTNEDERKLEIKILNDPEWDETKENYVEDSFTRNKRIIEVVKNIIDAKKDEIIKLKINDSFVEELIEEQAEKAKNELDSIADQLKAKNLTPKQIGEFLEKINLSREELRTFTNIISPYSYNSNQINEIDDSLAEKYIELKAEKELLENKLKIEETARRKVEEEKKKIEQALEEEKRKGAFQGALIGTDKERIIGLQHQIYHSSGRISKNIKSLVQYFDENNIDEKIKKHLKVISLEALKINSIANFVTKANFNLQATEINIDIINFIKEYIQEIYLSKESKIIDSSISIIDIIIEDGLKLVIEFRPLEITTLVDNFIQNSEKANATSLKFNCFRKNEKVVIEVIDNGDGIKDENIEKIFGFGFTTTRGSGIGLSQVNDIIKKLNGEITVESKINEFTKFKIII